MPVSPELSARKNAAANAERTKSLSGAAPPSSSISSKLAKKAYDPSQRGPQNWYEEQHGPAAEGLPKEDVGPRLPPGGWKSSQSGVPPGGGSPMRVTAASSSGVPTLPQI